jgi:CRP-like cAMP-binding protein
MQTLEHAEQSNELGVLTPETGAGTDIETSGELYRIWACDNLVYGPISMKVLIEWATEGRVLRDSWVYIQNERKWRQAAQILGLHDYFPPGVETLFLERAALDPDGIDFQALRQFSMFANLSNSQLANFVRLGEAFSVQEGEFVMRRREPGDAIYFLLSGQVRARIMVGGDEKVLSTCGSGEFLGEMAMLTQTQRSADVVANEECKLLRFSAQAFQELIAKDPALAAPIMYSIASIMARRVANVNNRFQQEVTSGFVWR